MNYQKISLLIASFASLYSTNLVYVSNADPAYPVQVIDVDTRTLVGNITGTYVESMGIAANSAGTKLYLVDRTNQSLDVIDVYQNAVVSQIPLGDSAIYQVAITPDDSKAFVTSNGSSNFYEVDLATETVTNHIALGLFNNSGQIVITEDGAKAYVGNFGDNTIVAWYIAAQTGAYVDLNGFTVNGPQSMAVIPNSNKVYVANSDINRSILVVDTTTDKVTGSVSPYYSNQGPYVNLLIKDSNIGFTYLNIDFGSNNYYIKIDVSSNSCVSGYFFESLASKPKVNNVLSQVYTKDKNIIAILMSDSSCYLTNELGSNLGNIPLGGNPQALVATEFINNPPVVYDQTAKVNKNTPKKLTLIGTDIDGDSITFSIVSQPTNGTLGEIVQETATTASVIYTPNTDYLGLDSFTYQGKDSQGADSNIATFSLEVFSTGDNFTDRLIEKYRRYFV